MRTAFIQAFIEQARQHPRLFLAVGDLGFSVVEPFAREFPDRFLNVGVAEQNMTGLAAGLASEGWHVFTYSIANFPTLRCFEQFRNDVCYHNLPVTVVSVGAGLAYGNLGYSHHAVQDLACFRTLPRCTVLSPADPGETRQCLDHLVRHPGPSYLRLGKAGEPALHDVLMTDDSPLRVFGPANAPRAMVATGSILAEALAAARQRAAESSEEVAVYSLPWIAPMRVEALASLWRHTHLFTVEEHVGPGGLGEMLAAARPAGVSATALCLNQQDIEEVGSQSMLRRRHGVSAQDLVAAVEP
ncbi:MAG: transketolase family protein [Verrucomicrobiales bacterium]